MRRATSRLATCRGFCTGRDHRGFDFCSDSQSVGGLQKLAARGARYFIEDRAVAAQAPGFEAALKAQFPVVAETPAAVLFALSPPGGR